VEPHAALAADGCELIERIDRSGARRAAVCHDEEREPSGCLVGRDRGGEDRRVEPQVCTDRQHPKLVGPKAERARRAAHRVVRLVGGVDDEVVAHRADERLARAGERGQIGRGAAVDE
jgi:hypothetical protein